MTLTETQTEAAPARRRWWQRLPVLATVGVLPVPFGLYFLGFVAIALLLTDRTRDTDAKAGGAVLLLWWAYSFREGDTSPYLGVTFLAIAAALLVRSIRARRRTRSAPVWGPLLGVVAAVALGVVAFVPDGYREPRVGREEAVRLVVAERTAHPWRGIAAASYLAERGRARLVHTPLWYVALYEPNATVARTADGQPCFTRREVWRVDALDGSVSRVTYDEARVAGDPCLPLRVGTGEDLRPVPR